MFALLSILWKPIKYQFPFTSLVLFRSGLAFRQTSLWKTPERHQSLYDNVLYSTFEGFYYRKHLGGTFKCLIWLHLFTFWLSWHFNNVSFLLTRSFRFTVSSLSILSSWHTTTSLPTLCRVKWSGMSSMAPTQSYTSWNYIYVCLNTRVKRWKSNRFKLA